MTQIRKSRGLSLKKVAATVGTNDGNLSRIERGLQTPKQEVARKLFELYGGAVPLANIYDPVFVEGL
jgi:transcriptional regulator with XRE-family HTH domain